jgi:predicted ATPase
MRLKSIFLKNFKRFTELEIQEIPDSAKLVLLIGTNGSGKSSLFDSFEMINTGLKQEGSPKNHDYYKKNKANSFEITIKTSDNQKLTLNDSQTNLHQIQHIHFYGRTSFRQVHQLTRKQLGQGKSVDFDKDTDRPRLFIEKDIRFENDLEKVIEQILKELFRDKTSTQQIAKNYIEPINKSLLNIFGNQEETTLQLIEIIPPLDGNVFQINFRKGFSEIHYDNLSAGEKEVVNILMNLLVRRSFYQDAIYFMDELDMHLNTKIQYQLLKEITENWIPDKSQLWTASHSLGFIDYANDYANAVILDFDNLDFDKKQIIRPSEKNNYQIFEIAVSKEFIDRAFQGKKIFFAEETDAPIYNNLGFENTFFFDGKDKLGVFQKSKNLNTKGIIDRDYLTDDEVVLLKKVYPFLSILPYYSIENLLYHPDNLEEYYQKKKLVFNKNAYIQAITYEKNANLTAISYGISKARDGYPFFKDGDTEKHLKKFKDNKDILKLLDSDEFEQFYKIFPAKEYGTTISFRQNIPKKELERTNWFRNKIEEVISTS